jgi:hypothetical protein
MCRVGDIEHKETLSQVLLDVEVTTPITAFRIELKRDPMALRQFWQTAGRDNNNVLGMGNKRSLFRSAERYNAKKGNCNHSAEEA